MASSLNVPESNFLEKSLTVPNSQFEELLTCQLCYALKCACKWTKCHTHDFEDKVKWLARNLHILTLFEYSTPLPLDPAWRPKTKRDSSVSSSIAGERIGWLKILASTGKAKLFNVSHYSHHQHYNSNAVTCCINLVDNVIPQFIQLCLLHFTKISEQWAQEYPCFNFSEKSWEWNRTRLFDCSGHPRLQGHASALVRSLQINLLCFQINT